MVLHRSATEDGLTVYAYPGDACILLAFDLPKARAQDLAGFSIRFRPPGAPRAYWLLNRLSLTRKVVSGTPPERRPFTRSNEAPFQTFRWVHVPRDGSPGRYRYEVIARYFDGRGGLRSGPSAAVEIELGPFRRGRVEVGFTRGYVASQAYADKFPRVLAPGGRGLLYDTRPFETRYAWLGYHARRLLSGFLDECLGDPRVTVDCFAYDLDEPDVVRRLERLGPRLRLFLDDASLHTGPSAHEPEARRLLERSAGAGNVRVGHFSRFAHHKVLVMRRRGRPVKVLAGSANFSVRGLYVQANSVLVFDDAVLARHFGDVFDQAFTAATAFRSSPLAARWFARSGRGLPDTRVSFAPHRDAALSLAPVAREIAAADRSVLYAVMSIDGGGPALQAVRDLGGRNDVFSYGISQTATGLTVYPPGKRRGIATSFAYLRANAGAPFREEWSGGSGQTIHHKFVVIDFNDSDPVVFTGSSNLAAGGETANGDNLLEIRDREIATVFAVEAIRLVDHYHFRAKKKTATAARPLRLQGPGGDPGTGRRWWERFYDPTDIKFHDRQLFVSPEARSGRPVSRAPAR